MCDAITVAKYVINKCTNDGMPISNLQLQKILYYLQAAALQEGEPLFDDRICAWQFGPVVPSVYYKYCGYGGSAIMDTYRDCELYCDVSMINRIVESKRELPPWELVKNTHAKDGAWDIIYNNGEGNRMEIPLNLIIDDNNIWENYEY